MITHIIMGRFVDDATQEEFEEFAAVLHAFAATVDGLERYRVHRDAKLRPGNNDIVVIATFRDEAAMREYFAHPEHHAAVAKYGDRLLRDRNSVQFVSDD